MCSPAQASATVTSPERIVLVQDSKIVRTGNESGIVVAIPITERFSLGGTVKYGNYSLTNNVQAQVCLTIFLPTSWEYRLPK